MTKRQSSTEMIEAPANINCRLTSHNILFIFKVWGLPGCRAVAYEYDHPAPCACSDVAYFQRVH